MNDKFFDKPLFESLLEQNYFAGIGNYLRSTIIYYANVNPFESTRKIIEHNPNFLNLCKHILEKAYQLHGGQFKDWSNPFKDDSYEFKSWVYYQKGYKIQDSHGRTFWYDPKWHKKNPPTGGF